MSKRNEALEALTRPKPVNPPASVELKPEQPVAATPFEDAPEPVDIKPAEVPRRAADRKTVANSAARAMLYLPPRAKRKFKEIAFHENRKEHDVYVEALREYLERRGHKGLL
jgi:hypothetical protein